MGLRFRVQGISELTRWLRVGAGERMERISEITIAKRLPFFSGEVCLLLGLRGGISTASLATPSA